MSEKDIFILQTIINIAKEHSGTGGKPETYYDTVIKNAEEIINNLWNEFNIEYIRPNNITIPEGY